MLLDLDTHYVKRALNISISSITSIIILADHEGNIQTELCRRVIVRHNQKQQPDNGKLLRTHRS